MILITGASGFLGTCIVAKLRSFDLRVICRNAYLEPKIDVIKAEINLSSDYTRALENVDVIIHCAARAHIMNDTSSSPLDAYREVNTLGTLNLARQAAKAGVKRFIFISSIKVNGENTNLRCPFRFDDQPLPEDDYGLSKAQAEKGLWEIAKETNMEVVIIRPPLVYGPGVKANFASMMRLATKNLPLPLGSINNKRSMVGIDNLVDLIVICIDHPNAANKTFLVSDDHDVSTTELLVALTKAAGNKPRLIPMPMSVIQFLASCVGKKPVADRLCGSLQVDISHTKETLVWKPPVTFEQGIARCFEKV